MTQKAIVAKTLLTALPRMHEFVQHLRLKNYATGIASIESTMNTEMVCARIIDRIIRQNQILDLKVRVRSLIESLPERYKGILHHHYVQGKLIKDFAKKIQVTERTAIRQLREAEKIFARNIGLIINTFMLSDLVRKHKWFKAELERHFYGVCRANSGSRK